MRGILLSTEKLSSISLISVLVILACATQIFAIPQDPWADAVVDSYNLGAGKPNNTLGPPYPASCPADWSNYGVRINPGGYLILDMGEGEEIPDIPGNDLYIEEIDKEDNVGFDDDPYEVYISNDTQTWYHLGQGSGDSEFDINGALPDARYVKLVGITTHSEINAIGILKGGPRWWRGNTHTHSTGSDGDSSPANVAAHYKNLGYDFLVLTDHCRPDQDPPCKLTEFQKYSDPNFLCIDGEEMTTTGSNHTNGIGLTSPINPGTIQENVNAVLAQGGIPHVNHLTWSGYPDPLDSDVLYPVENLKFMEIHNALTDDWDEDIWDDLLSVGKLMYGIGSDDCHQLYSQSGRAWIMVRAPALTLQGILSAMNAGDFYASTGVILNDCIVNSNSMVIDSVNGTLIKFIGQDGQILNSVESSYAEYSFLGTESYVRAKISKGRGRDAKYAWCQPVFISPLNLMAGWQIISLLIDPPVKRLKTLFPEAVVVYGYEKDKGYVRIGNDEDLEVGRGYWILLNEAKSYTLTGSPITSYTQSVSTDGWAMIGGCTHQAQVLSQGCDIGVIYGYDPEKGYQRVLESQPLEPGKGYWILLNNVAGGATISVEKVD